MWSIGVLEHWSIGAWRRVDLVVGRGSRTTPGTFGEMTLERPKIFARPKPAPSRGLRLGGRLGPMTPAVVQRRATPSAPMIIREPRPTNNKGPRLINGSNPARYRVSI
jgi:hypothetical protein